MCSSKCDRNIVKYGIAEASGFSAENLKKKFGFSKVNKRKQIVEEALTKASEIRRNVDKLANIKEKVVLQNLGIHVSDSESSEQSSSENDDEVHNPEDENIYDVPDVTHSGEDEPLFSNEDLSDDNLLEFFKHSKFNWFAFVLLVEQNMQRIPKDSLDKILLNLSTSLKNVDLTQRERLLFEQSKEAFMHQQSIKSLEEEIDAGIIVSELNQMMVVNCKIGGLQDVLDQKGKQLIAKVKALRCQAKRQASKKIAEARLLRRKRSKRVGTILQEFPGIGKEIQQFVESHGMGADSWWCTGVLTFDGNRKRLV
jgi:hypothetical protein